MNKNYLFLENFLVLLKDGYSIYESLDICYYITQEENIRNIQKLLSDGESIENTLLKCDLPSLFKEYFMFFQSKRNLSDAIEISLNFCKMQNNYLNKIKKELSYPLVLIIFILLFSLFVIFILIPKLNELFISFDVNISFYIRLIMNIFYLLPMFIVVMVISVICLIVRLLICLRNKDLKVFDLYFKIPVFRYYLKKYFSLKFAIYYNEFLKEKLDTHTIIHTLNEQLRNSDIKIVLYEIENKMMDGELLEDIIKNCIYFDDLLIVFFKMVFQYSNNNSLNTYIDLSFVQLEQKIKTYMKIITAGVYIFVSSFVIMIYLSIIVPMMNVVSGL